MKKLLYATALLFASINLSAQTYWGDGFDATFDKWVDITDTEGNVTGQRPWGWQSASNSNWTSGSNNVAVTFAPTTDRKNEEGKACKITTTGVISGWFTWHVNASLVNGPAQADYNPLFIGLGDDFYYTFWAKADVEGTEMWIGCTELYDPNKGGSWDNVPKVSLTTNWKQYGFQGYANMDITSFAIQTRKNAVRYIDDIALEYGDLPELEDPTALGSVTGEKIFCITSTQNGISFHSEEAGTLNVFNSLGTLVAQKEIHTGADQIVIHTPGIYLIKLQYATGQISQKVAIK